MTIEGATHRSPMSKRNITLKDKQSQGAVNASIATSNQ